MNVRTVFDLARIGDTNHFRRVVLNILIEPDTYSEKLSGMSDEEIQALFVCMFTSIADDLHVIRLARVWNAFYAVYQRDRLVDVATRGLLTRSQPPAAWMSPPVMVPAAMSQPPKAAE